MNAKKMAIFLTVVFSFFGATNVSAACYMNGDAQACINCMQHEQRSQQWQQQQNTIIQQQGQIIQNQNTLIQQQCRRDIFGNCL
jgi:hypothetical protein